MNYPSFRYYSLNKKKTNRVVAARQRMPFKITCKEQSSHLCSASIVTMLIADKVIKFATWIATAEFAD